MSTLKSTYVDINYHLNSTYDYIYQLVSTSQDGRVSQQLKQDKFNHGIRELQNIVEQIEFISNVENAISKPELQAKNIVHISKSVFEGFRSLADQKGIEWIFNSPWQELKKETNEDILLRMLSNLLSYLVINHCKGDHVQMNVNSLDDNTLEIELNCQIRHEIVLEEKNAFRLVFIQKMIKILGGSFFIDVNNTYNTSYKLNFNRKSLSSTPKNIKGFNSKNYHINSVPEPKEESVNVAINHNILIIEDIEGASYNLRDYLENNIQIFHSDNTIVGVKRGIRCNPSVIIYDNVRSVQRGVNILRYLKSNLQTATIPIFVIYLETPSIIGIKELLDHSDVQLHKPYSKNNFVTIINQLLEISNKSNRYLRVREDYPVDNQFSQEDDLFLQKVYQIIHDNIENTSFDVPTLCLLANVSKSQMHRKLKSTTGFSALKIIRTVRINKAQQLLKSTTLPVSQVAFQTGFRDSAYFAKIFFKSLGQTPTQFRKRYR